MKEIVTTQLVDSILKTAAVTAPVAGLVAGAAVAYIRRKRITAGIVLGLSSGLAGTAVFGLWRMYTALGDKYNYTSVSCFVIQLLLFAGLGVGSGFFIQKAITTTSARKRADRKDVNGKESPNAGKDLYRG